MPYGYWNARLYYIDLITCIAFELVYSVGVEIIRFL